MKRLVTATLCGLVIASACSLDWDRLDPSLGARPAGGADGDGGSDTGGDGGDGGSTSVGGAGGGGGCTVDADCTLDAFCGCASIGVVGVAESGDVSAGITIATPDGVARGDVMIAGVAVRPDGVMAVAPPGWTLIRVDTSSDDVTENLYSYYRIAEADEAPSHAWAFSAAHTGAVGGIIAFRGADPSDPIDVHDGQTLDGPTTFGSLSVDAPSLTTRNAESMVITLYSVTSSGDWQPGATMSEAVEVASHVSSTSGESLLMSYAPQATAGVSGVRTAIVMRHDGGTAASQAVALKPLCTTGSCTPKQLDGWTCSDERQCQSGNCVHNHCCDGACDGTCEACDVASSLGTCSPATVGMPGTPTCEPYTCNGVLTTCPASCTSHVECAGGSYCSTDTCTPLRSIGQTCSSDLQCQSGKCINGFCCNSDCDGACQACNLAGTEGTCTLRPAGATGSPSCSPYTCSGSAASCPTSCSVGNPCAPGFTCTGGSCV